MTVFFLPCAYTAFPDRKCWSAHLTLIPGGIIISVIDTPGKTLAQLTRLSLLSVLVFVIVIVLICVVPMPFGSNRTAPHRVAR